LFTIFVQFLSFSQKTNSGINHPLGLARSC
jgi:hypothetical protein